jgi:hypothetical protein
MAFCGVTNKDDRDENDSKWSFGEDKRGTGGDCQTKQAGSNKYRAKRQQFNLTEVI